MSTTVVLPAPGKSARMLPTSYHISEYILATAKLEYGRMLDRVQIDKLTYLVNGFTMRIRDDPAFHDTIEAWKYGPVVRLVYEFYRQYGEKSISRLEISYTPLDDIDAVRRQRDALAKILGRTVSDVADQVVRHYGDVHRDELMDMTHGDGTPWKQVYRPGYNKTVTNDIIRKFYRNIDSTTRKSSLFNKYIVTSRRGM